MGYERKSLQILGGSFNCLPPVDKVPATDYLLAQNWRSDALGRLVSRAGYALKFSIPGAGIAHSASSMGGVDDTYDVGDPYYVAANSGLVDPTSTVYYNGAAIATGFDGNRVGFASQNGFMYIMNRGKQGRHSAASGWETWNLSSPVAAPTAVAAAAPTPLASVAFAYAFTGNDAYVHSLTIAGATYSCTENSALGVLTTAAEIANVIAYLANADPNCSVTYPGIGGADQIDIWPIPVGIALAVSGSDGNGSVVLARGAITGLPNGTYQFYLTFLSADLTLESNPGSGSIPVTVVNQNIAITIPAADAPTDPRVGFVCIYATGGTLSSPYKVGQVASTIAAPATAFLDTLPDLQITNNGVIMSTVNGAPPPCAGIIGPQWDRLYAWSDALHVNRLYYTRPGLPQYWNTDEQAGDWVEVGDEGECIVWVTLHTNLTVIYKEKSIWMIVGDPATGTLEQVYGGLGLANQFALAAAGQIDYFVAPNGLCLFDMAQVHVISGNILPLFNQSLTNAGPLTPPGSVLPGSAFNSRSMACYAVALGHALGRLYIAYAEQGSLGFNLLVFDEGPEPERNAYLAAQRSGRWFYHRNGTAGTVGFLGFFFDGVSMLGLTGQPGGAAAGFSLSDFRGFLTEDPGPLPIECVYQSHYEDCGLPDNDKQFLEVAVDYEFAAGVTANVAIAFNNGVIPAAPMGTLTAGPRRTVSFAFQGDLFPEQQDAGILARNISVLIDVTATGLAIIHNVYLFYYHEARLALVASTIPTDLGVGKIKECRELELDIDATLGSAVATIVSDLPGNALAIRATPAIAKAGRALLKFPFTTAQGLLWQLSVVGNAGIPFRLYAARLLMRVIGVFVEAYESAGGFVWDSMEQNFGDGDDKTFDQLRFEIASADIPPTTPPTVPAPVAQVTVNLLTDLPGEAFVSRGTFKLTSGATSRAWVTVPLPDGIDGRSVRLQTTGTGAYSLYKAQVRYGRVGRYLAGSTPSGNNDQFRTLEFDFASERMNMFKRLEIDLRADAVVSVSVITDQDRLRIAPVYAPALSTPNGRSVLLVPLPPGTEGRLLRVNLTSPAPARIYRIRVWTRPLNEPTAQWGWKEFPLEASDVVPVWADLILDETPPVWQWVDLPMDVTG